MICVKIFREVNMDFKTIPTTIEYLTNRMKKGNKFTFSRYGDGEWNAIRGRKGCNCDKHEYFPRMGKLLRNSLAQPRGGNFMYAAQTQTDLTRRGDFISFYEKEMKPKNIAFWDSDVFHVASERGELNPIIKQLRTMHCCVIGPNHLRDLRLKTFVYQGFVEIPPVNCFQEISHIEERIKKYQEVVRDSEVVYCFSASMPAKIMIWDLWPLLGEKNWLIDFGSLWDVYVGKNSRKYHARVSQEIIAKNMA
jgi:hypothetical protein